MGLQLHLVFLRDISHHIFWDIWVGTCLNMYHDISIYDFITIRVHWKTTSDNIELSPSPSQYVVYFHSILTCISTISRWHDMASFTSNASGLQLDKCDINVLMTQINVIHSNRPRFKLNNNVECVLCGSTLPSAVQARRSVLIYTLIHALSVRSFLWLENILSLIKQRTALSCSCYNSTFWCILSLTGPGVPKCTWMSIRVFFF